MVACVPHDYMSEVVRTVCCGEMQRCKVVLVRCSSHGLRGVPSLRELQVTVPQLREIILLKRRIACQRLPI